ncbi:MAG TPA: hypothetical protein VK756_07805 [Solirubrobacteraceae bacterium]|nr:hypothetical protein [Solirubrobacteraceae bacterium]
MLILLAVREGLLLLAAEEFKAAARLAHLVVGDLRVLRHAVDRATDPLGFLLNLLPAEQARDDRDPFA